jgi:hypothetical protein
MVRHLLFFGSGAASKRLTFGVMAERSLWVGVRQSQRENLPNLAQKPPPKQGLNRRNLAELTYYYPTICVFHVIYFASNTM